STPRVPVRRGVGPWLDANEKDARPRPRKHRQVLPEDARLDFCPRALSLEDKMERRKRHGCDLGSGPREERGPELAPRRHRCRGEGDVIHDCLEAGDLRPAYRAPFFEVLHKAAPLVESERAERIERRLGALLGSGPHVLHNAPFPASASVWRSRIMPRRMRVFTVPSGW